MSFISKARIKKNMFTPNSSNKNNFFKNSGWYTFFPLYLWSQYKPIWTKFTAQTATLGANLLVKAQTIPQNAKCQAPNSKLHLLRTFEF